MKFTFSQKLNYFTDSLVQTDYLSRNQFPHLETVPSNGNSHGCMWRRLHDVYFNLSAMYSERDLSDEERRIISAMQRLTCFIAFQDPESTFDDDGAHDGAHDGQSELDDSYESGLDASSLRFSISCYADALHCIADGTRDMGCREALFPIINEMRRIVAGEETSTVSHRLPQQADNSKGSRR